MLVFEVDETDTEVFRETVVCPSAVSEHVSAERVARHLVDVQQVRDTVTTEDLGVRSEASYAERDSRADQVVIFGDCIDIERPRDGRCAANVEPHPAAFGLELDPAPEADVDENRGSVNSVEEALAVGLSGSSADEIGLEKRKCPASGQGKLPCCGRGDCLRVK